MALLTRVELLPAENVVRPGEIFHFGDQLGPYPMHAAEPPGASRSGWRAAASSAGKGIWRKEIPISGHFCGFARSKTRLLPTKCRSTFRRRAPAASARPWRLSRVHWVRPELVAEVKYLTWTDDNLLRQVVYEGLREDKPATEVRRPVPHPKAAAADRTATRSRHRLG